MILEVISTGQNDDMTHAIDKYIVITLTGSSDFNTDIVAMVIPRTHHGEDMS